MAILKHILHLKSLPASSQILLQRDEQQSRMGTSTDACLAQVEIHDGQLIGTLGKQQASRQTLRNSSRLLSDMGPGTFFGSGSLLNGEGDLQVFPFPNTSLFPSPQGTPFWY